MNINVSLPEELLRFIKAKVETGRYTSSSEVVREALRLLEKHDEQEVEKLRWLQQAWKEGVESGDGGKLDLAAIKADGRRRLSTKA